MAHFAELNRNNEVLRVVVVADAELLDGDGVEQESLGISFCNALFGGTWKQTSYNGNRRKNFAGIGYSYDSDRDAFIPKKPHASWVLSDATCQWEPPVPMPADSKPYIWNEDSGAWEVLS